MKTKFILGVFFLCGVNLFSQNFIDRVYYVNPAEAKRVFLRINGARPEKEITPNLANNRFHIDFNIFDTADSLVFSKSMNNFLELSKELFFTEDSVVYVPIPSFEWKGEVNKEYAQVRNITNGKAPDGEYILRIGIASDVISGRGTSKHWEQLSSYKIVVDGSPPSFAPKYISVPSEGDGPMDIQTYYIYTTGDAAEMWKYEVRGENSKTVYDSKPYTREDRLGIFSFTSQNEDCIATIYAIDGAKNETLRTLRLPQASMKKTEKNPRDDELLAAYAEIERLRAAYAEIEKLKGNTGRTPVSGINSLSDIKRMPNELYPYLEVPDITFPGYLESSLLMDNYEENLKNIIYVVDLIYPFINDFEYLHIHGYANPLNSNASVRSRNQEEENILKPLSLKRAEYIKKLFILMGIPEEKIKTEGMGGGIIRANPTDNNVNWQNRIVRFYLE